MTHPKRVPSHGLLCLCIIFTTIIFLAGCSGQSSGLFYALSIEEPISKKDSGLGKDGATYTDIVRYNSLYILKGSVLYVADVPNTASFPDSGSIGTWKTVSLGARLAVASIATYNNELYATFIGNADALPENNTQVLRKTSFSSLAQAESATWSDVSLSGLETGQIADLLFSANNQLFLQSKKSDSPNSGFKYNLYYLTGATWTKINITSGQGVDSDSFLKVSHDGSNYWLLKSYGLFKNTDLVTDFAVEALAGSETFPALTNMVVSGTSVFVTSSKNRLFFYNATTWSTFTIADAKFIDIEVFSMQDKNPAVVGNQNIVLASTSNKGLFTVTTAPSLTATAFSREAGNYGSTNFYPSSTDLSTNPDIFLANPGGLNSERLPAFALVPGLGLWGAYIKSDPENLISPALIWTWE